MIYPNDANGDALRRMEAQGDDLARPRNVDFSVIFADERSAEQFAKHFRALGHDVSVELTETNQDFPWDVVLVQHMGSEHPVTVASAADLALAYQSERKFTESEALAREALEFERKKQPDDWQRFRTESLLGASLSGQKRYTEAEPLLLEGYQGMLARKDRISVPDYYQLDLGHKWLVDLYEAWGKPEKAAEWRAKPTTHALASSSKP